MEVSLVFPHQLFESNPCIDRERKVYLIEEYLFFNQYKFHKIKLAYHRSTMKFYQSFLHNQGITVEYIQSQSELHDFRKLATYLKEQGVVKIHFCEVVDDWLSQRIKNSGIETMIYQTPMFLNSRNDIKDYFADKKRFYQTDFYIDQRKKRNILVDKLKKPIGGKWSFDVENRKKYPKEKIPPQLIQISKNDYDIEAENYISKYYSHNYGELGFKYPSTFQEARTWLKDFLKNRLSEFGIYEDAIIENESTLNHSILTPMLNNGLLTPQFVLDETLQYAAENEIPLNSLEGFMRQIIGWREYIRAVYLLKGRQERTKNFWKFTRKIPSSFYSGTTNIEPIDSTIAKVLQTGYNHHIERLMILGNFMLLAEIDPDDVYQWFMEMYIDAYDWVMVPNVYGMSQFADGGLMATKPYISGSNYLFKMSDFKKGAWSKIWDALFWNFMDKQRDFSLSNPRIGMLVHMFDKMPVEKRTNYLAMAENYLKKLI